MNMATMASVCGMKRGGEPELNGPAVVGNEFAGWG